MSDQLVIAGRAFRSRLIVGTGKYRSFQEMARAHAAAGADMVTVAVRRVNLTDRSKESLLDYIDRERIFILPNTAGCYSADEAVRAARLGREVGLSEWVKLEVIGDEQTLFPDTEQLITATTPNATIRSRSSRAASLASSSSALSTRKSFQRRNSSIGFSARGFGQSSRSTVCKTRSNQRVVW